MSLIHEPGLTREPVILEVPPPTHPGAFGREHIPAATSRAADLERLQRLETFPRVPERPSHAREVCAGLRVWAVVG
jgi:hypothetical protein